MPQNAPVPQKSLFGQRTQSTTNFLVWIALRPISAFVPRKCLIRHHAWKTYDTNFVGSAPRLRMMFCHKNLEYCNTLINATAKISWNCISNSKCCHATKNFPCDDAQADRWQKHFSNCHLALECFRATNIFDLEINGQKPRQRPSWNHASSAKCLNATKVYDRTADKIIQRHKPHWNRPLTQECSRSTSMFR